MHQHENIFDLGFGEAGQVVAEAGGFQSLVTPAILSIFNDRVFAYSILEQRQISAHARIRARDAGYRETNQFNPMEMVARVVEVEYQFRDVEFTALFLP